MTEEELDQANASVPDTDPRQDDGAAYLVFSADTDNWLEDVKKALFGQKDEPKDQSIEARKNMDKAVSTMLAFYRKRLAVISEDALNDPEGLHALAEMMASEMMFKVDPSGIAYTAALLVQRYAALLEDWAALWLNENEGVDEDSVFSSPERRRAVDPPSDTKNSSHRTGMYL